MQQQQIISIKYQLERENRDERETGRGDERDEHLQVVPDRAHVGLTIQVTVVDGSTPLQPFP